MLNIESNIKDYWETLKSNFREFTESQGYCSDTLKLYNRAVKRLADYAVLNNFHKYTPNLGVMFYESEKQLYQEQRKLLENRLLGIRCLERHLLGEALCLIKTTKAKKHELPQQFENEIKNFFESLRQSGYKETTIELYRYTCSPMLWYFAENRVADWSQINAKILSDFFEKTNNKVCFLSHVKKLFKYLVSERLVKFDYSGILPHVTRSQSLPSVYSRDEIKLLLDSVDRTTKIGKRDYAVLLLALRLGLRASDISLLCFKNVDFDNSIIKFKQFKTDIPQRLSLLPEVADSLYDYIDNSRVKSESQYIFLTVTHHPFSAATVYYIVSKYFTKSGIDCGDRHHGPQSLRMTLASELVEENVPYEAVRVILGQVNHDSTRHYVKFAIESLRTCALEVPPPSGLFAEYLKS